MTAAVIVVLLGAVVFGTWWVRNGWVYRTRTAILHADYEVYRTLPTYEEMMLRFWIWDATRFIGWHRSQGAIEQEEHARAAALGRAILQRAAERDRG